MRNFAHKMIFVGAGAALALIPGACATKKVEPLPEIPPPPPAYTQVPHPAGLDMADLQAIFYLPSAPKPESLKNCDADYRKLRERTTIDHELEEGARELVRTDPVKYHWCFYEKIQELEADIKKETYVDDRQKTVLSAFLFLTPMARAFLTEYHDSRYLRWAVQRYTRLSELVFFRKLELTPQATQQLVGVTDPWGNVRPGDHLDDSVLTKYGIIEAAKPVDAPMRAPAGMPTQLPQTLKSPVKVQPQKAPPVATIAKPLPSSIPFVGEAKSSKSQTPERYPATEPTGKVTTLPVF